MARRKASAKRQILPDPLFGSQVLAKFINILMNNGKKSVAEKIVYKALTRVSEVKTKKINDIKKDESTRKEVLESFEKALDLLRPVVEVRSSRIGGATYQVPVEVKFNRGMALAMRWLVDAANARGERGMVLRLAGEILDTFEGKGGAIKKREDVHRMAKANQAFSHYRW